MNNWIKCSDVMPKNLQPVLVAWSNEDPAPYYAEFKGKKFVSPALLYNDKWYWWNCVSEDMLAEYGGNGQDGVDEHINITHWMPMPDPPKEVNDEQQNHP